MNKVQVYKILQEQGFSDRNAELFISAIDNQEIEKLDIKNLSTKTDLLEIKMELDYLIRKESNRIFLFMIIFSSLMTVIQVRILFKIADIFRNSG